MSMMQNMVARPEKLQFRQRRLCTTMGSITSEPASRTSANAGSPS